MLPLYEQLLREQRAIVGLISRFPSRDRGVQGTAEVAFLARLQRAVLIDATNVGDWLAQTIPSAFMSGDPTTSDAVLKHLPNCAPSFPVAWYEASHPHAPATSQRYGCLVQIMNDEHTDPGKLTPTTGSLTLPATTRWTMVIECFGQDSTGHSFFGSIWNTLYLDGEGTVLGLQLLNNPRSAPTTHAEYCDLEIFLPLAAQCFMNCRNVVTTEHHPSRQVIRAAQRAGEPIVTYRTLDIAPMTRALREEGDIARNGLARALHIVRGGFARYTADAPLFGHFVGSVYRPAHTRGTPTLGTVVKDYHPVPPLRSGT